MDATCKTTLVFISKTLGAEDLKLIPDMSPIDSCSIGQPTGDAKVPVHPFSLVAYDLSEEEPKAPYVKLVKLLNRCEAIRAQNPALWEQLRAEIHYKYLLSTPENFSLHIDEIRRIADLNISLHCTVTPATSEKIA